MQATGLGVVMASGLVFELVRAGLALVVVCVLAFVGLTLLSRRGLLGPRVHEAGPSLRVLRRLSLGPRSSVYLVGVGDRTLVLGVGDGGAPRLIADLGEGVVATGAPATSTAAATSVAPSGGGPSAGAREPGDG